MSSKAHVALILGAMFAVTGGYVMLPRAFPADESEFTQVKASYLSYVEAVRHKDYITGYSYLHPDVRANYLYSDFCRDLNRIYEQFLLRTVEIRNERHVRRWHVRGLARTYSDLVELGLVIEGTSLKGNSPGSSKPRIWFYEKQRWTRISDGWRMVIDARQGKQLGTSPITAGSRRGLSLWRFLLPFLNLIGYECAAFTFAMILALASTWLKTWRTLGHLPIGESLAALTERAKSRHSFVHLYGVFSVVIGGGLLVPIMNRLRTQPPLVRTVFCLSLCAGLFVLLFLSRRWQTRWTRFPLVLPLTLLAVACSLWLIAPVFSPHTKGVLLWFLLWPVHALATSSIPPVALLLGTSKAFCGLCTQLAEAARPLRVAAFLDIDEADHRNWLDRYVWSGSSLCLTDLEGSSLRSWGEDWRQEVYRLIESCRVVLIDVRVWSPAIEEELKMIVQRQLQDRVIYLAAGYGTDLLAEHFSREQITAFKVTTLEQVDREFREALGIGTN